MDREERLQFTRLLDKMFSAEESSLVQKNPNLWKSFLGRLACTLSAFKRHNTIIFTLCKYYKYNVLSWFQTFVLLICICKFSDLKTLMCLLEQLLWIVPLIFLPVSPCSLVTLLVCTQCMCTICNAKLAHMPLIVIMCLHIVFCVF